MAGSDHSGFIRTTALIPINEAATVSIGTKMNSFGDPIAFAWASTTSQRGFDATFGHSKRADLASEIQRFSSRERESFGVAIAYSYSLNYFMWSENERWLANTTTDPGGKSTDNKEAYVLYIAIKYLTASIVKTATNLAIAGGSVISKSISHTHSQRW